MLEVQRFDPSAIWKSILFILGEQKRPRGYEIALEEWLDLLGGALPCTEKGAELFLRATKHHALAYKRWLERRPGMMDRNGNESTLAPNTIAFKLSAISRMYRAVRDDGLIGHNPFSGVKRPRKNASLKFPTELIEPEKVEEIIRGADAKQDRVLLTVFFAGAVRRDEARLFTIGQYQKEADTPYLYLKFTKGGADRRTAIAPWAVKDIESLIVDRKRQGASDSDYLFVTGFGKGRGVEPLSESTVQRRFKRECRRAGANPHASTHSARATAATVLIDSGVPIEKVAEFLGHTNIHTTMMYYKRWKEMQRAAGLDLLYPGMPGYQEAVERRIAREYNATKPGPYRAPFRD